MLKRLFFGNFTLMTDFFHEAKYLNLENNVDFITINLDPIDFLNSILNMHKIKYLLKILQ